MICRSEAELRSALDPHRGNGTIGFVPTMGALHEGHLSLIRAARSDCEHVVMSIFVNPLQFGPDEDFSTYPRDEARDLELAGVEGVDYVFVPSVDEMYPPERATTVSVAGLSEVLEGSLRPGHFDGVCTVVAKLLNQVRADRAYFGQKDAQQAAVVKRMVSDLSFPTEILIRPIVREPDGLAMSSRNAYLNQEQRQAALSLSRSLLAGRERLAETGDPTEAADAMRALLSPQAGVELDYAEAVDPDDFGPPKPRGPILLVVAARVGPARLIDNLLVDPDAKGEA